MKSTFSIPAVVKSIYFTTNAGGAILTAYSIVYFSHCGLSGSQIGLLGSLGCLVTLLAQPLWGALADHSLKTGKILFFLFLAGGTVELFFAFNSTFAAFLVLTCLGGFFIAPTGPLLDSYTFHHLGGKNRHFYSHFRLWGTYSFFLVSLGIGFLLDRTGLPAMFFMVAGVCLVTAFLCLFLEDIRPGEWGRDKPSVDLQAVRRLISHQPFLIFLACFFLGSLGDSCVWQFLSLYMKTIGTPQGYISWAWALGIPLEVVVFLMAPNLIKKWGALRLIQFGLLAGILRWGLLYLFPTPWAAMAVQLLQGLSFAGTFLGATNLVDITVPVSLKATGQSLYGASVSLAGILGSVLGGRIFDDFGVINLCLAGVLLNFLSLGSFLVFGKKMDHRTKNNGLDRNRRVAG